MPVGMFRSFVIDVGDLDVGEKFWASILGWEVQFRAFNNEYTRIGKKGEPSVLLQRVPETKTKLKNRCHVDLTVENVQDAVDDVVASGGTVVKPPGFWPDGKKPILEWAVMADPFGNEFCLIREVRPTL